MKFKIYTAISRKVVGKSARANLERYCGWFWVHCSSKKFERMARETMDKCLRVLKESNKSRFESYRVRNSELIVSHIITFQDCRVHIFFRQPFSKKLYAQGAHDMQYSRKTSWNKQHFSGASKLSDTPAFIDCWCFNSYKNCLGHSSIVSVVSCCCGSYLAQ